MISRRILLLLALATTFLAAFTPLCAEDTPAPTDAAKQFKGLMAEFRALRGREWRALGDYSHTSGLMIFASQDDAMATKLGCPPEKGRKYTQGIEQPDEVAKVTEWGRRRTRMLTTVREKGLEILDWCTENFKNGLKEAATAIFEELPDEERAHKAIGQVYSEELGWVSGEDAENVKKGLLPWGRDWLERSKVVELRRDWANAWEVPSKNFMARTNTSPALARDLLKFLEALRAEYIEYFGEFDFRDKNLRLGVNLFSDRDAYERNGMILHPAAPSAGAFYYERTGQTYMVAYPVKAGFLFSEDTVAHEESHQFFGRFFDVMCHKYYDKPGTWVNEALASYCESVMRAADRVAFVGYRSSYHLNIARSMIQAGTIFPLRKFVEIDAGPAPGSWERIGMFYSEGMSLTAFLLQAEGGKHRKGYFRYINDVMASRGSPKLFARCFGEEPEEMEPRFFKWIQEMK
ncbi:MAG: hypothetical protein WC712_14465 [Candidatus Brocadiia bacterium]